MCVWGWVYSEMLVNQGKWVPKVTFLDKQPNQAGIKLANRSTLCILEITLTYKLMKNLSTLSPTGNEYRVGMTLLLLFSLVKGF